MDGGLINAILFIDSKKAFDTIDHDILLQTLINLLWFKNKTIDLFKNYLTNRTQLVIVK